MGAQAVALARAVQYRSAGTVEFVADRSRNFYFLEMNTRLQVEHPVTELVTGLDLVELMIRVAAGEKLPFAQEDVRLWGAAVEARIYAEDPTRNFLPSIGRLVRYLPPAGEGLRLDAGVFEGAEISLYYDPMIAKLVAYGPNRDRAIDRLRQALDSFHVTGVQNNIAFLAAVAASPRFRAGALSTDFIAEEFPAGFAPPSGFAPADRVIRAAAALAHRRLREHETAIDGRLAHAAAGIADDCIVSLDGTPYPVALRAEGGGYRIEADGGSMLARTDWRPGQPLLRIELGEQNAVVQVERLPGAAFRLVHGGVVRRAQVLSPRAAELLGADAAEDRTRHLAPGAVADAGAPQRGGGSAGPGGQGRRAARHRRGDEDGECAARRARRPHRANSRQPRRQPRRRRRDPRIRVTGRCGRFGCASRAASRGSATGSGQHGQRRASGSTAGCATAADGTVELLATGIEPAIAVMIEACREGPAGAGVTAVESSDDEADGSRGFVARPTA